MTSSHETWAGLLRTTDLFADLDDAALAHLSSAFVDQRVSAGGYVVRQGEEADSLFVVVEGEVEVLLEGGENLTIRRLGPGSVLGEIALALGGKRSASVRAVLATRVLCLSREDFQRLLAAHSEMMAPLSRALQDRMRRGKVAGHLHSLFGQLDPEAIREIESRVTWVRLASGKDLFRQGDAADGAYIIVVGRLRVAVVDASGTETVIDDSGPGEWVGEMALLTGKERSATVYAVRDTELLFLSQSVFDDLVTRHPKAMLETARVLVNRLQRRMRSGGFAPSTRPGAKAKTLTVVPASTNVAVREFTRELVATLGGYGSVLHLTAERLDERLGKKGIARTSNEDAAQLRVGPWLMEQEQLHDFVVFEADPEWSGWTDRSVRHADHVLVVADARSGPSPGNVEKELTARFDGARAPKQSLVLLQHRDGSAFPGTARWLDQRRVDSHYHVRAGSSADISRLVRILSGHAISLVLGGGGSRGYAHFGVLRVLEELGIPVDAVGGASVGAIIAGGIALGTSSTEMIRDYPGILVRAFLDPAVPVVSLLSGKRVVEAIAKVAGSLDLEDVAIPYFCVSTNLTRGGEVVHRRGSAADAVRASTAIPGVLPPVPWKGDFLVDGGLSNNVPVDTMASLFGGAIIAVDVMPEVDLRANAEVSEPKVGWRAAGRRLNPLARSDGMPDILSILIRSATTASYSVQRAEESKKLAALYLRPTVSRWNVVDFKAAPGLADEGYRGTVEVIREWWRREGDALMGRRKP
jgi:predicted acylesterase/phospholipase RssA/CRP-like cAMP-binding protein